MVIEVEVLEKVKFEVYGSQVSQHQILGPLGVRLVEVWGI